MNLRKALDEYLNLDEERKWIAKTEEDSPEHIQYVHSLYLIRALQPMVEEGRYDDMISWLEREFDKDADYGRYDESDVDLSLLTAVKNYVRYM